MIHTSHLPLSIAALHKTPWYSCESDNMHGVLGQKNFQWSLRSIMSHTVMINKLIELIGHH